MVKSKISHNFLVQTSRQLLNSNIENENSFEDSDGDFQINQRDLGDTMGNNMEDYPEYFD